MWIDIIKRLLAAGMTQSEIGAAVGCSQPWVSAVLNGTIKTVTWEVGEKLRALHAKKLRRQARRTASQCAYWLDKSDDEVAP